MVRLQLWRSGECGIIPLLTLLPGLLWDRVIVPVRVPYICFKLFVFDRNHHHVVPLARISLTLSRYFSLSFIAFGSSLGLHPVSSHSCCMYVRAGRPAFAWPYVGVHRSTSLMSSSLLLQQCPACLVHLTCVVFVMGGKWPYSWCLVRCCRQDLMSYNCKLFVLRIVTLGYNCLSPGDNTPRDTNYTDTCPPSRKL